MVDVTPPNLGPKRATVLDRKPAVVATAAVNGIRRRLRGTVDAVTIASAAQEPARRTATEVSAAVANGAIVSIVRRRRGHIGPWSRAGGQATGTSLETAAGETVVEILVARTDVDGMTDYGLERGSRHAATAERRRKPASSLSRSSVLSSCDPSVHITRIPSCRMT
ncbi:hypothetical protein ACSAGD_07770 [Paramicrobacterium sp. CJ85]|uniref:hypothetical protein n=1 Tax=Paramicrobacterium sp. CJ85 TaxID=3445355 RepID=UPI003F6082E7